MLKIVFQLVYLHFRVVAPARRLLGHINVQLVTAGYDFVEFFIHQRFTRLYLVVCDASFKFAQNIVDLQDICLCLSVQFIHPIYGETNAQTKVKQNKDQLIRIYYLSTNFLFSFLFSFFFNLMQKYFLLYFKSEFLNCCTQLKLIIFYIV